MSKHPPANIDVQIHLDNAKGEIIIERVLAARVESWIDDVLTKGYRRVDGDLVQRIPPAGIKKVVYGG